jgi:hypothetical protein
MDALTAGSIVRRHRRHPLRGPKGGLECKEMLNNNTAAIMSHRQGCTTLDRRSIS